MPTWTHGCFTPSVLLCTPELLPPEASAEVSWNFGKNLSGVSRGSVDINVGKDKTLKIQEQSLWPQSHMQGWPTDPAILWLSNHRFSFPAIP